MTQPHTVFVELIAKAASAARKAVYEWPRSAMHCLRHTTGSVLANGGGERLASAKHFGYANMSNTIGYVRMSPEPLRDVWRGRR